MKEVVIPIGDFLDAALRACELTQERYAGMAVVVDRRAERRSRLLSDIVEDAGSIHDVTRRDLLVAVPGHSTMYPVGSIDHYVLSPEDSYEYGRTAPGLLLCGADDPRWVQQLWNLTRTIDAEYDNPDARARMERAIDRSTSDLCDYLGLSEAEVPSLVLFDLRARSAHAFGYGGEMDPTPYALFKKLATRRPAGGPVGWLSRAVDGLVDDWNLQSATLALAPPTMAGWTGRRYGPRGLEPLSFARGRE